MAFRQIKKHGWFPSAYITCVQSPFCTFVPQKSISKSTPYFPGPRLLLLPHQTAGRPPTRTRGAQRCGQAQPCPRDAGLAHHSEPQSSCSSTVGSDVLSAFLGEKRGVRTRGGSWQLCSDREDSQPKVRANTRRRQRREKRRGSRRPCAVAGPRSLWEPQSEDETDPHICSARS